MIDIATRKGQKIAVFGLGASGRAAALALAASGADVWAWDDDETARTRAGTGGVTLTDLYDRDFGALDALVLAPGIPLTHNPHRLAGRAREAGCPVIGDIELLAEACPATDIVAVTGTNGKSTTTALIGHILQAAGRNVQVGGNLGPPVLAFDPPGGAGMLVLELSSYQLDLTRGAAFGIAVLINISPDHLDRHGTMEGYIGAKRRIFRDRPGGGQTAIVGIDDAPGRMLHDELTRRGGWRIVPISSGTRLDDGIYALDGILFDAADGTAREICTLDGIETLPGAHNWQNAAAAFAACRAAGIEDGAIAAAMASFPGLPHRQEAIATIGAVGYVNDSKATNAAAAARALACYDNVYWIAGGLAKQGGLGPVLEQAGRIRHAYLIGDSAGEFAAALEGHAPCTRAGDLATAFAAAHDAAHRDGGRDAVVLLSPAAASFDQWPGFEARGDAFRALVAIKIAARIAESESGEAGS